jgi:hypothetical protein
MNAFIMEGDANTYKNSFAGINEQPKNIGAMT